MRGEPRRHELAAYPWSLTIETRFGDLDLNGHLNNVAIARLYEEARVRFNGHVRSLPGAGRPRFVVARLAIDYLGEARYPAPVAIGVAVLATGRTSWTTGLGLFQDGVALGLSETVLVHRVDNAPAPLPDGLRAVLGDFALRP